MAKVIEEKEEVTPKEDESGGVVTTVKENVTKDLDVQQLIDDNEPDDETKEEKPAKKVESKPAAKKDDDDDAELDFNSLTPEQKKAVGRMYKERRTDRRKLRELESTVEELKRRPIQREEAPVVAKTKIIPAYGARPQKPDPTKFNSPEEFDEAEAKHDDDLYEWRKAKEASERAEVERADAQAKAIKTHNERQAKFAESHDDYEDVIENDLPMSDIMFGAVVEEEVGPALAYHLAKNPELNNKIYNMTPTDQIKAIMRLIVKLESDDEPLKEEKVVVKKVKQPEPATPVGGRQAPKIDVTKLSFKERERQFARDNPGMLAYEP